MGLLFQRAEVEGFEDMNLFLMIEDGVVKFIYALMWAVYCYLDSFIVISSSLKRNNWLVKVS